MMHKRTLHSLLIVSFIAIFAVSAFAADEVLVGSKQGLLRCADQSTTVTANIDAPVSAVEVVLNVANYSGCGDLENLSVTWDLASGVLTDRFIDLSQAPMIRFVAVNTSGAGSEDLAASGVIATIGFKTVDCVLGEAEIAGAVWPSAPPFGPIETQFVDAGTGLIRTVAVTAGIIEMINVAPTMVEITGGPFSLLHGATFTYQLEAEDDDDGNGCETLVFDIVSGPAGMTIEAGNVLTWITTGDDVCAFDGDIVISVTDDGPETDEADAFTILVTNNPPAFTVEQGEEDCAEIAWGEEFAFSVMAVDPDPGPYGPIYHVIDWTGPGAPEVDGAGNVTWQTGYAAEFTGTFEIVVEVNDGANVCAGAPANADTTTLCVTVVPFQLTIEKVHKQILGQATTVSVTMLDSGYENAPMGGFDFLFAYDASAMTFQMASPGAFLEDCEWEYFTYRFGANGNCGAGACPTGVVRVIAMAETTGGNLAHHPTCYSNGVDVSNELVVLHFLVTNDFTLECNYAPIRWVWYDCADNGVSNVDGSLLYISDEVYDYAGDGMFNVITGLDNDFPTLTGAPAEVCDVETAKGKPWRLVRFYNGGLDLICSDSIDGVGDINLNEIPYEIADAVMFTNYFVSGLSAFGTHIDGSVAASDTNKDGITLSVADLVYLIRVIVGDAQPYAKLDPVAGKVTYGNSTFTVDRELGAAHFIFAGNVTPELLATNMDMRSEFDGVNTRVLVYSENADQVFSGSFLRAEGRILATDFATPEGNSVVAKVMPTSFEVGQNYPNPFNPTTKITIQIPNTGAWSMDIFNINGQLVESFSGVSESGFEDVVWDASNLSSGVYFYKVVAGQNSITKKAVLLK